ncbi:hypothetical protein BGX27_004002 [Mortierella sp. AM989]|nr:hypothetical protein BGX27_004002 [Mortierella sp. AM989]
MLCLFAIAVAAASPLLSLLTPSNSFDYDCLPDISDANLRNVARFRLNRAELSPSHLTKRAIAKPYLLEEPQQHEIRALVAGYSASGVISPDEPVVRVPLTSIPKDFGYTATFSIGTYNPEVEYSQLFNLLVDTGSDMVVVTSAICTDSESVLVPNRYNCSASLTCTPTQNKLTNSSRWIQRYGDGTIANGTLVQDTLRFVSEASSSPFTSRGSELSNNSGFASMAALKVENQPILVVDQPGLRLVKSYGPAVDGIIGLNLRSPVISSTVIENLQKAETMATAGVSLLLPTSASSSTHSLVNQFNSGMSLMSLWLTKSHEPGNGGELLLNAVDKSRFRGPIRWSKRGPSPYDWSIPLDQGLLLRDPITASYIPIPGTGHTFAVLDSGSDGIYLQKEVYNTIFERVPGAKQLSNGYWRVPCEGTMELVFGIEGKLYRLPYEDWVKKPNETASNAVSASAGPGMCQARVFGSSPGPTLLGTTFLRSVYTVFDFTRPGFERMGFAALH